MFQKFIEFHLKYKRITEIIEYCTTGAYPEIFRGGGLIFFVSMGKFWDFFLKNPSKLKKFFQKKGGPEYTPAI